jgi:hypothetical protein
MHGMQYGLLTATWGPMDPAPCSELTECELTFTCIDKNMELSWLLGTPFFGYTFWAALLRVPLCSAARPDY